MKRFERLIYFTGGVALITLGLSVMNANASGFDNTGIGSLDLLYDPAKFALEFGTTYVNRNVEYKASNTKFIRDKISDSHPPNVKDIDDGVTIVDALPNVWNYAVNAKFDILDNLSCLARINNPGTILEELPEDWNGRYSIIKTELTTVGFDTTCAFKIPLSFGQFRVIGGARYVEAQLDVLKLSHVIGSPSISPLSISGSGLGWRVGIAYEIPEYALRASLIYDHEIEIDATGELLNPSVLFDARSTLTYPRGVEFRVQSGIAPNWLVFAGIKWANFAVYDKLTVNASSELFGGDVLQINRIFNWSDGWTVTAGIGHQLTEKIQLGSSLTWDSGIGGSYSDTYQWGLGGAYKLNDNVTWSLGGAIVYKTAANNKLSTSITDAPILDTITEDIFNLSYDSSWNFGLGAKLKLSF